jgi:hypothetical protein
MNFDTLCKFDEQSFLTERSSTKSRNFIVYDFNENKMDKMLSRFFAETVFVISYFCAELILLHRCAAMHGLAQSCTRHCSNLLK